MCLQQPFNDLLLDSKYYSLLAPYYARRSTFQGALGIFQGLLGTFRDISGTFRDISGRSAPELEKEADFPVLPEWILVPAGMKLI